MALNKVLIALSCTLTFPVAALAQSPAWAMADTAACCTATTDGDAIAASVLLPAPMILADDARATALAAAVLLPQPGAAALPALAVDHAAHGMSDMACCGHDAKPGAGQAAGGCCQDMKDGACCKDGCDMPCCQSLPPR